jgi:hypothetical protein
MLFQEIVIVYYHNNLKRTNTLCGQSTEFYYVTACGTYNYY